MQVLVKFRCLKYNLIVSDKKILINNNNISDSNHNCCLNCQIAKKGYKCYSSPNYLECFEDHSYCDGENFDCPTQNPKKANSICNSYDYGKCDSLGHCLSICQQKGHIYTSCLCSNTEEKCQICCRKSIGNMTGECRPYHELLHDNNNHFKPYYLSNGRTCLDGLCENVIICVITS